jgi:hypothetical protein
MDSLRFYTAGSDSEEEGEITASSSNPPKLPVVNLAPAVAFNPKPTSTVAIYDERNREIRYAPKYDELFAPEVSAFSQLQLITFTGWSGESFQNSATIGQEEYVDWLC